MKIEYQCSNCGKWEKVSATVGIPHGMFALGYRSVGGALYCPDCVNSWAERNGKPFDEQYKDVGHMFAEWWNATVLKKAKAEHKQLKKYGVNEIGWYEDRGEVQNDRTRIMGNIKIKCDDCKFAEDCVDYGWEGCKKFIQKQPHTNEEWFCNLSTEEKAEKLTDFSFWLVPNYQTEDKREQIRKNIELWLKEKHDGNS